MKGAHCLWALCVPWAPLAPQLRLCTGCRMLWLGNLLPFPFFCLEGSGCNSLETPRSAPLFFRTFSAPPAKAELGVMGPCFLPGEIEEQMGAFEQLQREKEGGPSTLSLIWHYSSTPASLDLWQVLTRAAGPCDSWE